MEKRQSDEDNLYKVMIKETMMVRVQWRNLARMPGLHPYSFSGFIMTIESQDLGLTSHPKNDKWKNDSGKPVKQFIY